MPRRQFEERGGCEDGGGQRQPGGSRVLRTRGPFVHLRHEMPQGVVSAPQQFHNARPCVCRDRIREIHLIFLEIPQSYKQFLSHKKFI